MMTSENTDIEKYIHYLLYSYLAIFINDCLIEKTHHTNTNYSTPLPIDWTTATTQLHNDYYERNWFSLEQ